MNLQRTKSGMLRITGEFSAPELFQVAQEVARQYHLPKELLTSPKMTATYLTALLGHRQTEGFHVLFLSTQNELLASETLFEGTLDSCAVYIREVVVKALQLNAAAVIFAHNHPSGNPAPSMADRKITAQLKSALDLVSVRVLDHFIVGTHEWVSMAERGEI